MCGQVRRAVRQARRAGSVGAGLTPVFAAALRCAQRVRDVPGFGGGRHAWGTRAVDVGLHALGNTVPECERPPQVLVVGAGRMAADVVQVLAGRGLRPVVAARDEAAAGRLVSAARVLPLGALVDALRAADLVYNTTAAAHDVVTVDHVRQAIGGHRRRLTIVDLSVPRNVDEAVAHLPGVRLIGSDELGDDEAADGHLTAAVDAACVVVSAEVQRYVTAVGARRAGPWIAVLRRHVEDQCLREMQESAPPGACLDDVTRAAHRVAVRLLHRPTLSARTAAAAGDATTLRLLAEAFGMPGATFCAAANTLDTAPCG